MARQPKYIWLRELLGSDRSRHLSVILLTHLIWCRAGGQASQLTASIILQIPEVAYVDAQRNCAVALGERDVKTDVWNKESFNFLHLSDVSIVLSWLVRFECPPYRQGERDSAPGRPQETLLTCIWARWERGRDSGSFTVINITQAGSNLTSPGQAKRTLFYLSKAVEVNNYDENAFVSRSRYKNDPANNSGEIYLDAIICWDVTERQ